MNLYENRILPRIIDQICGHRAFAEQRAKVVPRARGRVLEVGYGSGTSLPWYRSDRVDALIALDPAAGAMALAKKREADAGFPIEHLALRGERVPLDDGSIDSIVVTYTLCTIPDVAGALAEMRRVLKPDGELLFAEHGSAPTETRRRWQARIAPYWAV
ncbi:MAG: class I SAM-dependent methyltransferase, partial [Myxococcales bacterium]|nr:class I SAM-dependent methyltransferase [Myxococcales bacterium]